MGAYRFAARYRVIAGMTMTWCLHRVRDKLTYSQIGSFLTYSHSKSVTSSQFDVICCTFIGPIPWGHDGPLCHALSLLLLSRTSHFDVICCTFIYGCERCKFCARRAINWGLGCRVMVTISVRVSCLVVRGR